MTWASRPDLRALAAVAGALVSLLLIESCASRPSPVLRPATAEESARFLRAWGEYREAAVSRGAMELFYDAEASRSVVTASGTLAVRDVPGRALSLRVEGPLGTTLARADWSGEETKIFVAGRHARERTVPAGSDLSQELGVPVTPAQLSWLLYGLPDAGAPEAVRMAGDRAWLSWNNDALRCDFDPSSRRVGTILSRGSRGFVEVRFLGWESGLPSRIRIRNSQGGGAELTLRNAEASAAP